MSALAVAVFWGCAALLVYAHFGYPALVWLWARASSRPLLRAQQEDAQLPEVAVIVIAHDEGGRIEQRIENLSAQHYPRKRVNIAIASDGSTDDTVARARLHQGARVQVFEFASQRGKPAVLNDLIPDARGSIVVLADARQTFDAHALRALVAPFADPKVGAVSGELMLEGAGGSGLYWRYEKFLRKCESRVDSTVGATGAIYAIRRALFEPLAEDTVLDDVLIACRITQRGYRVVFEPLARAHDRAAAPAAEFRRKVRTLGGNFQLFSRERWLLDPRRNRLWLQTVSHKLLRLACPLLLVGALVSSALLARQPLYALALCGQLVFYASALAGWSRSRRGLSARVLVFPHLFCLLHCATALGFVEFLRKRTTAAWKRPAGGTARLTAASLR